MTGERRDTSAMWVTELFWLRHMQDDTRPVCSHKAELAELAASVGGHTGVEKSLSPGMKHPEPRGRAARTPG